LSALQKDAERNDDANRQKQGCFGAHGGSLPAGEARSMENGMGYRENFPLTIDRSAACSTHRQSIRALRIL
jgi:hypothetical protein